MKRKSTNKDLVKVFQEGMRQVADHLECKPGELTRDQYIRVTVDYNLTRLNKAELNKLGGFANARDLFFSSTGELNTRIKKLSRAEKQIIRSIVLFIKDNQKVPILKDVKEMGFSAHYIDKLGGLESLVQKAYDSSPKLESQVFNEDDFTEDSHKLVESRVKKSKIYFITTVVSNKKIDPNFYKSIKRYCKANDAELLLLPCQDVASRNRKYKFELDPVLKGESVVFRDLYLNDNIFLSSIMMSAKQINPTTGLDRLAQAKGSLIAASPKQYLKYVANSNTKLPRALMTTGCLTIADYTTDAYMSKRTSYLAQEDHVMGGVIVEVEDKKRFHFRQVQANSKGEFVDLGKVYRPKGKQKKPKKIRAVFGDTHVGSHHKIVHKCLKDISKSLGVDEIILHDLHDGKSVNHHDEGKPLLKAAKAVRKKTSIYKEVTEVCQFLSELSSWVKDRLVVVKSNHDEVLDKYLNQGRFINDPENMYLALELAQRKIEGHDPLKYLVEDILEDQEIPLHSEIRWLERDEDYVVCGIHLDAHGDMGANGARGSLRTLEKAYGNCVIGHSHTAGILRGAYQVGTSSELRLGYNRGASSWTHTLCLIYDLGDGELGQRQLINMIEGKWHLDSLKHR